MTGFVFVCTTEFPQNIDHLISSVRTTDKDIVADSGAGTTTMQLLSNEDAGFNNPVLTVQVMA